MNRATCFSIVKVPGIGRLCLAPGALALLLGIAPDAAEASCRQMQILAARSYAAEIGLRRVAFYAADGDALHCYQLNPAGVGQRHAPWSTFKIPNLTIALETGVAPSLDYKIHWDPAKRPRQSYWPADWAQDQTLKSAFLRSAAWYYQELALKIKGPRYRQYLTRFGYGNAQVADGDDAFWLGGSLRISPLEQVAFISRLLGGELGVSQRTREALDEVSLLQARLGYELHGKTGSGPVKPGDFDGPFEGWLVGYVRRPNAAPLSYALYVSGPNYASIRDFRPQFAERLLHDIGAWPSAY